MHSQQTLDFNLWEFVARYEFNETTFIKYKNIYAMIIIKIKWKKKYQSPYFQNHSTWDKK